MRPIDLRSHLQTQPFRPFRVHLSNGASYDVRHPELMVVSRTEVAIAANPGEDELPERLVYCDPLHITHIEPLDGKKPKRRKTKRK